MLNKRGEFATGLLPKVIKYIGPFGYACITLRKRPNVFPMGLDESFTPYKSQLDALDAAIEQEHGTISMPTGSGKSAVIAMIAHRFNVKTLVVVPSIEIKRQLSETLKNHKNVIVENIDSKALNSLSGIDCLIIDEAHHVAAKTYQKLNKTAWKGVYYRFFLTATAFRNNDEENLLFEGIAGKLIYRLTYKEAVKQQYIVPIEAYSIEIPKQKTNAVTWAQVYSELVVRNTPRNVKIVDILTSLHSSRKSTLCLVKEVSHGKILSEMSGLPFCCGEDEDSRKYIRQFNSGNLKVLIATEGMMGEGVDTKPCEFVMIAGLGKAKSSLMQKIGRAIRTYLGKESGKIIIFRDPSHKFCLTHYRAQCNVIKDEYNVKVIKLESL